MIPLRIEEAALSSWPALRRELYDGWLASLVDSDRPVACGVGVIADGYFALFDIVTDPKLRGRGYGTKLISGLPGWALENGGRHAYLQVVEANEPARHICARLGFDEAYRYWYRVPSSP